MFSKEDMLTYEKFNKNIRMFPNFSLDYVYGKINIFYDIKINKVKIQTIIVSCFFQ